MRVPCRLQSDLPESLLVLSRLASGRPFHRCLDKLDDTIQHLVQHLAILLQSCLEKDRTKLSHERPFVTAQQNRTDALRCSGDKYQAERTGSAPESDLLDCSFLSRRFTERGNHKVPCWTESTARVEVSNSGSCFQIQAWSFAIKIATRKQCIRH